MASTPNFPLISTLMVLTILAPMVAGSRSSSDEVTIKNYKEELVIPFELKLKDDSKDRLMKNVDGLKEAMIEHIYESSLNCFENGYLCASNGQCCSRMCIWYEQGGHLCQSSCLQSGTNGCTFNNDCCSNYCEWKWGKGNNLCH
ncbi:uncharacterized protein LOC130817964 [Amaranthus tricolor]|uniref:uncharacterized protein LOC130817964 n=1 Tax=Amaranthus tricolor TaxID=29722 RepID=UPI002591006F|nr:uncharacterized protein LOC130817964 [Amaranthus tricolor]